MAEICGPSDLAPPLAVRVRSFVSGYRGAISATALIVLTAWLALSWFQTTSRIARYYTPLPTLDYWRTAAFLKSYQAFDFRVLWEQHNEHRIVFPEIIFAADSLALHGLQLLPLTVSFVCYFGSWLLLARAFARDACVPPLPRAIGILLAGIIIGWQGSAVVLADTFLLEWSLSQFAVLLALTFLARLGATGAAADLIATILCALVATYSSANGLMLWPVLLGAALVSSIRKRQLVALAAAGSVAIAAYFIGYNFTDTLSIGALIKHPLYLLEFAGAYLSMPFGAIKRTGFGIGVGLISLALTLLFAIAAVRNRLLASRTGIVLFGWYLFMLLTVLLTAAGRMAPAEPTFSAAKAARYLTGPLVTWAAFMLLSLWLSSRLRRRFAQPYAIALVFAALLLAGLPKLRWWLRGADQQRAKEQMAALAIELGVEDASVELNVFPDPAGMELWAKGLRESQLSVFYDGRSKWLGKAIATYGSLHDAPVPGEITYTFPVLQGVEAAGWVDDSALRGSTGWLVLANEAGQIVGFGRKLPAGFPDTFDNARTPPALGWVGFVSLKYPVKSFSAYAVGRQSLVPIEASAGVPPEQPIRWPQAGPRIKGIEWQKDKSWTANALLPRGFFGQGPSPPIYSSWSGNDRNTGRIMSSVFPAPANACLVLPALQGPNANGLAAGVMDADTGHAVANVPFQNADRQWTFWRLPLPGSVKHLRITAEDMGKNWGEWLAIGNPLQCN